VRAFVCLGLIFFPTVAVDVEAAVGANISSSTASEFNTSLLPTKSLRTAFGLLFLF
jgi:hypothetical protein